MLLKINTESYISNPRRHGKKKHVAQHTQASQKDNVGMKTSVAFTRLRESLEKRSRETARHPICRNEPGGHVKSTSYQKINRTVVQYHILELQ